MLRRASAVAALLLAAAAADPEGSATYRSDQFGYGLEYPPGMELRTWFGGATAELRDAATGATLATLDVWPADLCPRERPGTTAKALGAERAAAVTQADGDDGSSSCGRPVRVRAFASRHGAPLYELVLSCRAEHHEGRKLVRQRLGTKGPTFFADISQAWRARVLMVDPAGVDPRTGEGRPSADVAAVRAVLGTLTTFPLPKPDVVCIDDLR